MRILNNVEAIFLVATALVLVHGFASAALPASPHYATATVSVDAAPMQVVTIVGKSLTAAEKAE